MKFNGHNISVDSSIGVLNTNYGNRHPLITLSYSNIELVRGPTLGTDVSLIIFARFDSKG